MFRNKSPETKVQPSENLLSTTVHEKNPLKSLFYAIKSAQYGDYLNQYLVGMAYYQGKDVKQNFWVACYWFEKAKLSIEAELEDESVDGDDESTAYRDTILRTISAALDKLRIKAIFEASEFEVQFITRELERKAFQQPLARDTTAVLEEDELHQPLPPLSWPPIRTTSERELIQLAEQGNLSASIQLADYYSPSNSKKAFIYHKIAADLGHGGSLIQLVSCYSNGHGVEKNPLKALFYMLKLARSGRYSMQYYVGDAYCRGNKDVSQNLGIALYWFMKAHTNPHKGGEENMVAASLYKSILLIDDQKICQAPIAQVKAAIEDVELRAFPSSSELKEVVCLAKKEEQEIVLALGNSQQSPINSSVGLIAQLQHESPRRDIAEMVPKAESSVGSSVSSSSPASTSSVHGARFGYTSSRNLPLPPTPTSDKGRSPR